MIGVLRLHFRYAKWQTAYLGFVPNLKFLVFKLQSSQWMAAWQGNEVQVLLNIRSKLRSDKLAIDPCGWQQG